MSLNTCAISGHLGKAAELRYTNSQLAVVTFSVAVNERAKQADGSYQDVPHWFDCVMFGKRAEALQPYLAKGTKLSLAGHLRQNKWEKDGRQYSRVEIVVDEVELMNTRREAQSPEAMPPQAVGAASVYDSDIPF